MAGQNVAPIIPNLSNQEAAVAGSQAVVFTATDRKVIEERGGTVDKSRSFLSILKDKPLTPAVENEETNIKPEVTAQEFEGRIKNHKKMLRHSVIINPQDKVLILNQPPDSYEENGVPSPVPEPTEQNTAPQIETIVVQATKTQAAPIKEEPQPNQVYDQLNEEQKTLNEVRSKVKRYHLERLFTDSEEEFQRLSEAIRQTSMATARPESKTWLAGQLQQITVGTAEYKLKLLGSLDNMEHAPNHKKTITWLKKTIASLSKA